MGALSTGKRGMRVGGTQSRVDTPVASGGCSIVQRRVLVVFVDGAVRGSEIVHQSLCLCDRAHLLGKEADHRGHGPCRSRVDFRTCEHPPRTFMNKPVFMSELGASSRHPASIQIGARAVSK